MATSSGFWASLGKMISTLMPFGPIYEEQRVTYHKHWSVMVRDITVPLGMCLVTIPFWYWSLTGKLFGENSIVFVGVVILTGFGLLWLFWRYENWRNDYYVVTDDRIIDVKRLPFGFHTESREASLGSVQNISMRIPNMLAASLGYGDVEIETAGRDGQLIFESVPHPREVLAEVSARIEEFKARLGTRERERRDREMIDWFTAYAELERVKIVRNPPKISFREPVSVEWRVDGKPAYVETFIAWDEISRPNRDYTYKTSLQSGGIGNYLAGFTPMQTGKVYFAAMARLDGVDYWSMEHEIPVGPDSEGV